MKTQATTRDGYKLLHQGALALSQVEHNGIKIDVDYLERTVKETEARITDLEKQLTSDRVFKKWRKLHGDKTKLGSRPQLASLLYDHMGFESKDKTETGRHKADEEAFNDIDLPFVKDYVRWQKLQKVKGTYLEGIRREVVDGFLHPVYNLHTARTYRSCVAGGMMVHTEGGKILIEDVKEGDKVLCWDHDKDNWTYRKVTWSGKTGRKRVVTLSWRGAGLRSDSGGLVLTPDHQVLRGSRLYSPASVLARDELLAGGTAGLVSVWGVFDWGREEDVYDLEVEGAHNFVVNGVCVHNSSSDPNFQNLPIRNQEFGELIRRCFIPRKGRVLVEMDFSGAEVRVACCYTHDPKLIEDFTQPGKDPHGDTAMKLFFLTKEQVDKRTTRDWTKNRFVFPQFYGSVYFQCAPHMWEAVVDERCKIPGSDTSVREHLRKNGIRELGSCESGVEPRAGTFEYRVRQVEQDFWQNRFKVYSEWKKRTWNEYQDRGYFTTLTGFRIEGYLKRNEVLNYGIQGGAFHCLLWTLIRLQKWLTKNRMKAVIIGQIHDSVLVDCPVNELQDVLNFIRKTITVDLAKHWSWVCVPMECEADVTPVDGSWFEKSQWVEEGGVWRKKS